MNEQEYYLAHHGVKGMKWGVRRYQNPDGSLTNAGKKRLAKSIKKDWEKPEPSITIGQKLYKHREKVGNNEITRMVAAKKEVISAREKWTEALTSFQKKYDEWDAKRESLEDEFYNDTDVMFSYKVKAYKKLCEKYPQHKGEKLSKDNVWLMYEDWDQGDSSSFDMFCKDRGLGDGPDFTSAKEARKNYMNTCKTATNEILGSYGSTKVKDIGYMSNLDISSLVSEAMYMKTYSEIDTWKP